MRGDRKGNRMTALIFQQGDGWGEGGGGASDIPQPCENHTNTKTFAMPF